jgi:DNA-binding PadR family transcriptional regulator
MSLKFALLGLIALKPASGYDIKRIIDRSIYFVWNVTGPQIYNTLRTLREEGLVSSESVAQQGKPDKQIHSITPKGMQALQEFANEPVRASVTRDDVLLRIFFGNFADDDVVVRELGAYLDRIRNERAFMEATEARIRAHPGERHKAREFQLLSLRLKVAQYRAMEQELARFLAARDAKPVSPVSSRGATARPRRAAVLVYPSGETAAARRKGRG